MEQTKDRDINTNEFKWTISFTEITRIFPNVKEIHFVNRYKFDNTALKALIKQIQARDSRTNEPINKVEKVVFSYFAYNRNVRGMPPDIHNLNENKMYDPNINFFDPQNLNENQMNKLRNELGWDIKWGVIGEEGKEEAGYKISIWKNKLWTGYQKKGIVKRMGSISLHF